MMKVISLKHAYKTCPRCGAGFACKSGSVLQCQCYGIELPETTKQLIGQLYEDCLCRKCLETLRDNPTADKPSE